MRRWLVILLLLLIILFEVESSPDKFCGTIICRASKCIFQHSDYPWGENLAMGGHSVQSLAQLWYTIEVSGGAHTNIYGEVCKGKRYLGLVCHLE